MMKLRIVVRGNLENSSKMRTDLTSVSQVMIATTMCLAALQPSATLTSGLAISQRYFFKVPPWIKILVVRMPKDLPGGDSPGGYYIVTSTVYGTII